MAKMPFEKSPMDKESAAFGAEGSPKEEAMDMKQAAPKKKAKRRGSFPMGMLKRK